MPSMPAFSRMRAAQRMFRVTDFALKFHRCLFCGPSFLVRLRRDESGVRCVRCGASAVHLSLGLALRRYLPGLLASDACELSARGPLAAFLSRYARSVALSEFFNDAAPGSMREGVRCEDVQRLTYTQASFDLVTHTEVLEHVPDDGLAFTELRRILRPAGLMLFTVPLSGRAATVERARLHDGRTEYLLPAEYHHDPLRAGSRVLVYRDYGGDVVDRLRAAGFAHAWIDSTSTDLPWGHQRAVVCARR
jgi:SAM-dependent methyltransferase